MSEFLLGCGVVVIYAVWFFCVSVVFVYLFLFFSFANVSLPFRRKWLLFFHYPLF